MRTYYIVKSGGTFDRWYCMGMPWTGERKEAFRFRSLRAAQSMALKLHGHNRVIKVTVKATPKPKPVPVWPALARINDLISRFESGKSDFIDIDDALDIMRDLRNKLSAPFVSTSVDCALALIGEKIVALDERDVIAATEAQAILRGIRSKLVGQ